MNKLRKGSNNYLLYTWRSEQFERVFAMGDQINVESSDRGITFQKWKGKRLTKLKEPGLDTSTKYNSSSSKAASYNVNVNGNDKSLYENGGKALRYVQPVKSGRPGREGIIFTKNNSVRSTLPTVIDGSESNVSTISQGNINDRFTTQTLQRNEKLDKYM